MERKLWKIGEKHNVDWTAIVEAIAKLFSQGKVVFDCISVFIFSSQ